MRIQRAIFYLLAAVLFGASAAPCPGQFIGSPYYVEKHAGAHHVPLDGAWQLGSRPQPIASVSELQGQEWFSTRLPGSVQMAMYHAGKLPDPYQGMNSKLYARLDESV